MWDGESSLLLSYLCKGLLGWVVSGYYMAIKGGKGGMDAWYRARGSNTHLTFCLERRDLREHFFRQSLDDSNIVHYNRKYAACYDPLACLHTLALLDIASHFLAFYDRC